MSTSAAENGYNRGSMGTPTGANGGPMKCHEWMRTNDGFCSRFQDALSANHSKKTAPALMDTASLLLHGCRPAMMRSPTDGVLDVKIAGSASA